MTHAGSTVCWGLPAVCIALDADIGGFVWQTSLFRYHVRPSALLSVLQAAGVAAGAAAALVPHATRDAAIAALQESLTDLNNDNLRLLREAGLSDEVRGSMASGAICTTPSTTAQGQRRVLVVGQHPKGCCQ